MSNHDRSACLVADGEVVAAVAEERLDRRKSSEGFYRYQDRGIVLPPSRAITALLRQEGIGLDDLELVVCGRSIKACRSQLLEYIPFPPERVVEPPVPGHHLAHAYSAYGTCPFEEAAVLVIDEQGHRLEDGRFERCSWFEGDGGPLVKLDQFFGDPSNLSLGMFYNVFAALLGLSEGGKPSGGKLMALAACGKPYMESEELVSLDGNGDVCIPLGQIDKFLEEAGIPIHRGMRDFEVRHLDDLLGKYIPISWNHPLAAALASKAQTELERAILHVASALRKRTNAPALAYAGGVALNCSVNCRIGEVGWRDVYIHPAATDDGNAVGLALYGWIEVLGRGRPQPQVFAPFLGPTHGASAERDALAKFGFATCTSELDVANIAERLQAGNIICWFSGRSEWGPRALGSRSILASPLISGIKDRLNRQVKFRESFRPFGISGTARGLRELISFPPDSASLAPYMLAVANVIRDDLPEVTHTDGTVRFQLVLPDLQPEWHAVITAFGELTGTFAVINTSFNTVGEPLVETPEDAVRQFLLSGADALVVGRRVLAVDDLPASLVERARDTARRETHINVLDAALRIEAAGFPDSASEFLVRWKYDAEAAASDGVDARRRFHGFWMRRFVAREQWDQAQPHAAAVLASASVGTDVGLAAMTLGEHADNQIPSLLSALLGIISDGTDASRLWQIVLGQRGHTEQVLEGADHGA